MNIAALLDDLGEPVGDEFSAGWDQSIATYPEASLDFLTPEVFLETRAWSDLPQAFDPLLEKTAKAVLSRRSLRYLAWHTYRLAHKETEGREFSAWPELDHALSGSGGIFYLLLVMAGIPLLRETHRGRGIPEAVTHATGADFCLRSARYERLTGGQPGMEQRLLNWYGLVGSGDLYRLGRLEYHFQPFKGALRAYRHRQGGPVLALSEADVHYDEEGYVAASTADASWTSTLTDAAGQITGFPICPSGKTIAEPVALQADAWGRVLQPGDRILGMHIPEGEAMTLERCRESMAEALVFFPRYHPEHPFVGFECMSWILNTQLADMLGSYSNLVKYQEELYLFPLPSSGTDGLYFVFDSAEVDPDNAPRDTTLRRAYLDHLRAGKRLRGGGMFFTKEDFTRFGTQHYRSQFAAAMALAG